MMRTGYDAIAGIYDADMGASMALPDLRFYVEIARSTSGPVLELGCGTGRVMAALFAAGIDVYGVDLSAPMLRQARVRLGVRVPLIQMDMRRLGLRGRFALAVLPYSLATYLDGDSEWRQLAEGLRRALAPGGRVLIDAFIPQPLAADTGWVRDYARRVEGTWLVRHKRIQPLGPNRNRIERRYRMRGAYGGRTLVTTESITTYAPADLRDLVERHIGPLERVDFDYATKAGPQGARFVSILARYISADPVDECSTCRKGFVR